ncbi:YslB family protein [Bacillus methanolicus]|nr:YslB family protein [Bacillus methanolicus]
MKAADSDSPVVTAFGYELIRDILLPELLGKDEPEILYWAGKRLARQFPLKNFDEMCVFFQKASWGTLIITNESSNELEVELTGGIISQRLQSKKDISFQLEAGFIAQQIELQKQVVAEAFEHPRKKGSKVQFTVKWDKKDIVKP